METKKKLNPAIRVSIIAICINFVLAIFMLVSGLISNSSAILSESMNTAADVFSTFIVIIGVHFASKTSDKDHQYGHEKLECISAIILSVILFITGASIGYDGIKKVIEGVTNGLTAPSALAIVAACVSIGVKEFLFFLARGTAKKVNSPSLMADAWHHHSDALCSVGSLVGVVGARLGLPILDPLASVIICILVIKAAYDIFSDSIHKLVDRSCDDETINEIERLVLSVDGVLGVDMLMTRLFGSKFYVDIEISVNGQQTLFQAHDISQRVHDIVEVQYPNAKHCMVHMNPYMED
ncbi:MAG: cation diffusion facilitator family transporter [Oscillospiraceae bacterium]